MLSDTTEWMHHQHLTSNNSKGVRTTRWCGGQDAHEHGGAGDECEGKQHACSVSEFEVHWAVVGRVMMGFLSCQHSSI
jgi:hypothetical protein